MDQSLTAYRLRAETEALFGAQTGPHAAYPQHVHSTISGPDADLMSSPQ